ncbi:hypothetical protein CWB96_07850 [Pseudoalteromonas citrea]|uniref:Uncharacterized protein n=1 Tax=Pseudoalteromonas citrea TaxID=43655 RepID=A0A5S3XR19_9GAMM|nr:hypothetical protein [Pseudoalteromonas citrea]TMP41052.1 hypothetical protein CWB97_16040 [Pseudoalteromonas citrea]TMP60118.1 hypothetical protein CWB96_07850 [Pseudoalteromonas citrea]
MSDADFNCPQQPLPREGAHYDTTPLELSHVNLAVHDTWLRALSIIWNDDLNKIPWKKDNNGNWVQVPNSEDAAYAEANSKADHFYTSFETFLRAQPISAFHTLGFNDPDAYAKKVEKDSLPAISVISYQDLLDNHNSENPTLQHPSLERFRKHIEQNSSNIEEYFNDPYTFKPGTNGWFSVSTTAPAVLLPQLVLIIPPKPKNPADQGMALVDYKLAGLSYPFTICA